MRLDETSLLPSSRVCPLHQLLLYMIFIMLLPDIYCLTCKQISFRNFLFDTVKQFLQCHFLSSFILPLLLWLQNWYLFFLFHGRNRENRKKSKTLERKNVASNYARISNAWVFPFPVEPRLDATHRLCVYIYIYVQISILMLCNTKYKWRISHILFLRND